MKVLLVDDEAELVETLAERLIMRNITADWATGGEEALFKAEKIPYDIAVLDVKMPGLSGITLKKLLEQKNPGMKFIFMTGHGSEDDFHAGSMEAGQDYYLVKPVNIEDLIKKMNEVVSGTGGTK
ncbi:MAG: response regulator transcription factor [Deltaproteobacteria bacterium]|nr:response regulator transcription factor [Deltaproteobacteria bacterium]